jgi:3-dehydroquinate synthase
MVEIRVALGPRSYRVSIGEGALRFLPALGRDRARRRVFVSSPRVWRHCGRRVERALGEDVAPLLVPDAERRKSLAGLSRLLTGFAERGLDRRSVVVAVGGGVVGDLAGFAAAVYMRGIDWIQVPTTLLAMVDSSVGGKVGVNHAATKNLVGSFHQPLRVVADTALLATLPRRERRSGAFEILKCAVLADPALFRHLARASADPAVWNRAQTERAVAGAVRVKAGIVARDEREGGLRRLLNLGHTLGHAFEAATGYRRFTHGEAVGLGLLGATEIARARGMIATADARAIGDAVERLGPLPAMGDLPLAAILGAVARDKKARGGRAVFVLPTGIGRAVVRDDVTPAQIRAALAALAAREGRA